jgi:hypothetical protein
MPKTFLEFVNWLLSFGPKLPQAFAIIDRIVNDLQELAVLFTGKEMVFGSSPSQLAPDEIAAVEAVESEMAKAGISRGPLSGVLVNLWQFIQAHPELLTLLVSLLKK